MFASADDLAAAFFSGRERLESVKAQDLHPTETAVCLLCGGGPMTEIVGRYVGARLAAETWSICFTCRKPWQPAISHRGQLTVTPRPDATEDRLIDQLDRWRALKTIMDPEHLPAGWRSERWATGLDLWRIWLDPLGGSCSRVSELANAFGFRGQWSEDTVWRLLRTMRLHVTSLATRAGLLRYDGKRSYRRVPPLTAAESSL